MFKEINLYPKLYASFSNRTASGKVEIFFGILADVDAPEYIIPYKYYFCWKPWFFRSRYQMRDGLTWLHGCYANLIGWNHAHWFVDE